MVADSEVLTKFGVVLGPRGSRHWSNELKAHIVAKTLEDGAPVASVAHRMIYAPIIYLHGGSWLAMASRFCPHLPWLILHLLL